MRPSGGPRRESASDRRSIRNARLLAVATLPFVFHYALNRRHGVDEIESLHTAWLMGRGEQIYVDFFQHHNRSSLTAPTTPSPVRR